MKKILPILLIGIIVLSGIGAYGSQKFGVQLNINDDSTEMIEASIIDKVTSNSEGSYASLFSNPPIKPTISGPSIGAVNWKYCFEIVTTDPDNDSVYYLVDWGDGIQTEWLGPYVEGVPIEVCHNWSAIGIYYITVKAKDEGDSESEWSDPFEITIVENEAPLEPVIKGPKSGTVNKKYEWTFETIDPDGDDMEFYICWGGTCVGRWYGPYESGEVITKGYTYLEQGTFTIICKARDIYGVEGPLASFEVVMPRNKALEKPFLSFLQNHLDLHPFLRLFLQRLDH
jgi:hypothetical protein